MLTDLPQFESSFYGHQTYGGMPIYGGTPITEADKLYVQNRLGAIISTTEPHILNQPQEIKPMTKRIVRVFIADPDSKVPVENTILHKTEEKATDLTDQELFYELPIKEVLDKHNAMRLTIRDKEASAKAGKDIFLEPIKIRDLKMTVVVIAQF